MRTRKGDIFMIYHSKTITLKDGQSVIFRNPTPEKEAKILSSVCQSDYDLYIAAFAENKIVRNCQISFQK